MGRVQQRGLDRDCPSFGGQLQQRANSNQPTNPLATKQTVDPCLDVNKYVKNVHWQIAANIWNFHAPLKHQINPMSFHNATLTASFYRLCPLAAIYSFIHSFIHLFIYLSIYADFGTHFQYACVPNQCPTRVSATLTAAVYEISSKLTIFKNGLKNGLRWLHRWNFHEWLTRPATK